MREIDRFLLTGREIKTRKLYCPERNIDRFFIKHDFEKMPDLRCNAIVAGRFGRYR